MINCNVNTLFHLLLLARPPSAWLCGFQNQSLTNLDVRGLDNGARSHGPRTIELSRERTTRLRLDFSLLWGELCLRVYLSLFLSHCLSLYFSSSASLSLSFSLYPSVFFPLSHFHHLSHSDTRTKHKGAISTSLCQNSSLTHTCIHTCKHTHSYTHTHTHTTLLYLALKSHNSNITFPVLPLDGLSSFDKILGLSLHRTLHHKHSSK